MHLPFIFNRIFSIHNKATYVKCSGLSPRPFYLFPLPSTGFLQGTLLFLVIFSEFVCFSFFFWTDDFSIRCRGPDFNIQYIVYVVYKTDEALIRSFLSSFLSSVPKSRSWKIRDTVQWRERKQRSGKWSCLSIIWFHFHSKGWSCCKGAKYCGWNQV